MNTFAGIEHYKSIFWALRFPMAVYFSGHCGLTSNVWQPMENVIMVRLDCPWHSTSSEYKLDKNGRIYEHRVDNISLNSPPKFRVLGVHELIQSIGRSSTPKPTYFESSSSDRT
ncbi:hypothetical protein Dsin_026006 [Dipteronia sinensis]|uniref:Uncharacterized protein n=1 Tax=Dipteronia sinensis TaxID=43782 RepID=A0AAD9ZX46_9ROSI|nr:hypothetical protein Dsin_026006 [Dipteronia sinensis]